MSWTPDTANKAFYALSCWLKAWVQDSPNIDEQYSMSEIRSSNEKGWLDEKSEAIWTNRPLIFIL